MLVLGIESSCDETSFAVVKDGKEILSLIVASQEDLHKAFGGVIPELACRRHIDVCRPLLQKALDEADLSLDQIDLIAVTNTPGLIGALLIGVTFAKGLVLATQKPLVAVNHVEAHLYAAMMEEQIPLPALGVVISGGHTALLKIDAVGTYTLISQTQDDAIGEAFDKVARMLELPYPGGPHIERLAKTGDPKAFALKAGFIKARPLDFSFSGLKTSVLYKVKGQNASKYSPCLLDEQGKCDLAASFQAVAFEDLVKKALDAAQRSGCTSLVIGGGVSQNRYLKQLLTEKSSLPLFWPPKGLSLDNAAMIAGLGFHIYQTQGDHGLSIQPHPSTSLSDLSYHQLSPN